MHMRLRESVFFVPLSTVPPKKMIKKRATCSFFSNCSCFCSITKLLQSWTVQFVVVIFVFRVIRKLLINDVNLTTEQKMYFVRMEITFLCSNIKAFPFNLSTSQKFDRLFFIHEAGQTPWFAAVMFMIKMHFFAGIHEN